MNQSESLFLLFNPLFLSLSPSLSCPPLVDFPHTPTGPRSLLFLHATPTPPSKSCNPQNLQALSDIACFLFHPPFYTPAMASVAIYAIYIALVAIFAWDHRQSLFDKQPKLASNSYFPSEWINHHNPLTQIGRENATIVMLCRNSDLQGALKLMRSLEDRFNHIYHYPWVFLNDVPFDNEFKRQTSYMASGETFYELIPMEDWQPPPFIDEEKLTQKLEEYGLNGVIYGGVRLYRNMCHFNLGYFYKQKRLLQYDWYFRVEPDVEYMCDFQYDPFEVLRKNNKLYGFVIAIHEYEETIPTLWETVEDFMEKYPHYIHDNNALDFITSREPLQNITIQINLNLSYNMCHFWLNFEIGLLNFFRSEAYEAYFKHLDEAGGFYYERWGDAPVHLIAVSLLLDKNEIHHFEDIGYFHPPFLLCPLLEELLLCKRCVCRGNKEDITFMDVDLHLCLPRWWKYGTGKRFLDQQ